MIANMTIYEQVAQLIQTEQIEAIGTHTEALAQTAVSHPHAFRQTLNLLAFHKQTDTIRQLMIQAWPAIQASHLPTSRKNELATLATDFLLFNALQTGETDQLQAQIQTFFPVDADGLARTLAHFKGEVTYNWSVQMFEGEDGRQISQNLNILIILFMGWANREGRIALAHSWLMRDALADYFLLRRTGQLKQRMDSSLLAGGGRRPPFRIPTDPPHPLCPDHGSLERYLMKLLHVTREAWWQTAVFYHNLPHWLAYLKEGKLITPQQEKATQSDLQPIRQDLLTHLNRVSNDPALTQYLMQG